MKETIIFLVLLTAWSSCAEVQPKVTGTGNAPTTDLSAYKGTASITQGIAKTTAEDIYKCDRGRKTDIGVISSSDGQGWIVPAYTNFQNDEFPFAADLYNSCDGNTYNNAQEALSKLDGSDIIKIDADGEVFTAYVFGDNYFEMYVNGIPVGKDRVPFTQFNSSVIRFKAEKPFTIAMKLVDWEEHLGVGL